MITVWLRNVGDEDECWVPCASGDPGATAFMPASQFVHTNRLNDDLMRMNADLIAERNARTPSVSRPHLSTPEK